MRKINTITRYDVQYGKQVDFNPCIIRSVITDSGIDAQTYGDADFEENGLYEFNKEAFAQSRRTTTSPSTAATSTSATARHADARS